MKAKNKLLTLSRRLKSVPGWLSNQEGLFLFKIASKLPESGILVEIGSWKGKSTIWLGTAIKSKEKTKIYSIDPHIGSPERKQEYKVVNTYNEFLANIKRFKVEDRVVSIKKFSKIAGQDFNKKIDLLFIDGAHGYKDVKEDFDLWLPKVNEGGWIILHDATVLTGPWKVARDKILFSGIFSNSGMIGSMIFAKKAFLATSLEKTINQFKNFFSYLFIISYVRLRKIPVLRSLKKRLSKAHFRRSVRSKLT